MKQTFESVLKEFGFVDGRLTPKPDDTPTTIEVSINHWDGECEVFVEEIPIMRGTIKTPARLKTLLDILTETR